MKLALYKGRQRVISKVIAFWTKSQYSHCELVFSDGVSGSSSDIDGGVRLRRISYDSRLWDFYDVPGDEAYARSWFERHQGQKYDYLGLLGFIIRPIKGQLDRKGCAHAVMASLKYREAWRFDPGMLAVLFGPKEEE